MAVTFKLKMELEDQRGGSLTEGRMDRLIAKIKEFAAVEVRRADMFVESGEVKYRIEHSESFSFMDIYKV